MAKKKPSRLLKGAGGGSSKGNSPTNTPDTLRTQDWFEALLAIGEGPTRGIAPGIQNKGENFFVGGTPLYNQATGESNFADFTATFYPGLESDPAVQFALGGASANMAVNVQLSQNIPVLRQTTALQRGHINRLEVRVQIRQLMEVTDDGTFEADAQFRIEYKASDSAVWQKYNGADVSLRGKTTAGAVRDFAIDVPMRTDVDWEIRVTKLSPDNDGSGKGKIVELSWESLQMIEQGPKDYKDLAKVYIFARATNQFSSIPEFSEIWDGLLCRVPSNYNPETRTYDESVPWNGTFKMAWTNNPAFILQELCLNPRFGLPAYYLFAAPDRYSFYDAGKWCDEPVAIPGTARTQPRFTLNMYLTDAKPGLELLRYIAATFNATIYDRGDGVIVCVTDRPTAPLRIFTPETAICPAGADTPFAYSYTSLSERPNDVTVAFVDPNLDWAENRLPATIDTSAWQQRNGRVAYDFVAVGCTDPDEAVRRANYMVIAANTEATTVTFDTTRAGSFLELFETIYIADPQASWSTGGRIKNIQGSRINLRDPIYTEIASACNIRLQTYAGLRTLQVKPTVNGVAYSLDILSGEIPQEHEYPPKAAFTLEDTLTHGLAKPFRVVSVAEKDVTGEQVSVTAIEINLNKYEDGDSGLISTPPRYSYQLPGEPILPPELVLESGTAHTQIASDGTLIHRVWANWEKPLNAFTDHYEIDYMEVGSSVWNTVISYEDSAYIGPLKDGVAYHFRLFAVTPLGRRSIKFRERLNFVVQGKVSPITNVEGLAVAYSNAGWVYSWDQPANMPDYAGMRIRRGGVSNIWDTASPAAQYITDNSINLGWLPVGTTRTFFKYEDTSGNLSTSAMYADVNVVAPTAPQVVSETRNGLLAIRWESAAGTQPVSQYQLRWGTADQSPDQAETVTSTNALNLTVGLSNPMIRRAHLRAIDMNGNVGPWTTFVVGAEDTPDTTPPPTVTNLQALAALTSINITTDVASYLVGHGHKSTLLYAAQVTPEQPDPTFADADEVAEFLGSAYSFPARPGVTWRFWAKWMTNDKFTSVSPSSPAQATAAKIGDDDLSEDLDLASHLADGSISGSKLAAGSIDETKLANSVELIKVIPEGEPLPTEKLTTNIVWDGKLYTWDGTQYKSIEVGDIDFDDLTGQINPEQIADQTLTVAMFAAGIEPIRIVTALPSTKQGSVVMYNGELYRWNGTAYAKSVQAVDVTGQLATAQIADSAINTAKLAANAVAEGNIAANAVTTTKIADSALTTAKFAAGIQPVGIIAGTTVPTTKTTDVILVNGSVYRWSGSAYTKAVPAVDVTGQLASAQIADSAINTAKLADNAVAEGKIAAGAVSSGKLADGAVSLTKFASGLQPVGIVTGTVVPTTKTTDVIVLNGSVYRWNGTAYTKAVPAVDLSGQITSTQITDGAISTPKIAAGAVTADQVAANAITSDKIVANAITTGKIAAGAVTTAEVAAGAITTSKLAVGGTNMLYDVDVFDQIAGTQPGGGTDATNSFSTTERLFGTKSLQHTSINANSYKYINAVDNSNNGWLKLKPLTTYIWSAYVKTNAASTVVSAGLHPRTQAGANESVPGSVTATLTAAGGWTRVSSTFTTGNSGFFTYYIRNNAAGVTTFWDGFQIEEQRGDNVPGPFTRGGQVVIDGGNISALTVTAGSLAAGSVIAGKIAADAVTATTIAAGAVTTAKLDALAVTAEKVAAGAIIAGKIAADAVTATTIAANAVTSDKIVANAVTTGKIAAGAVTADQVAANAITATKLMVGSNDNLIPDPRFDSGAFTGWTLWANGAGITVGSGNNAPTAKHVALASSARTALMSHDGGYTSGDAAELLRGIAVNPGEQYRISVDVKADAPVTGTLYFRGFGRAITSANPQVNTEWTSSATDWTPGVTTAWTTLKTDVTIPANGKTLRVILDAYSLGTTLRATNFTCVRKQTGELIVDGAITAEKVAALAITAGKIAAGAVTAAEIAAGAVTTAKLDALAVTSDKVAAGAIIAGKIAADAVTAGTIATNAVTSDKIVANAITTAKIAAGAVTATEIAAQAIRASHIAVTARGPILSPDPYLEEYSVWGNSTGTIVLDNTAVGGRAVQYAGPNSGFAFHPQRIAIEYGKNYRAEIDAKTVSGNSPCYLVVQFLDGNGNNITGSGSAAPGWAYGSYFYFGRVNAAPASTDWTSYGISFGPDSEAGIPANARYFRIGVLPVYSGTGVNAFSNFLVYERQSGSLIVDGAITANHLTAGSVTAGKIAALAVTAGTIATNAVTSDTIVANAITTAKIAAGAITASQVAASAITTEKLTLANFTNLVPNPLFSSGWADWATSVSGPASVVANNSAGVPAGAPTPFVMAQTGATQHGVSSHGMHVGATGLVGMEVQPGETYRISVDASAGANAAGSLTMYLWGRLGNGGVGAALGSLVLPLPVGGAWGTYTTTVTIPAGSVHKYAQLYMYRNGAGTTYFTNARITRMADANLVVDGAITANKIAANAIAVGTAAIQNGAIVNAMIGNLSADKINAGTLDAARIGAGTITAGHLGTNSVTSDKIVAGAITADKILAGAITADKLSIGRTSNLCPDSTFTPGLAFWGKYNTHDFGTGLRLGVNLNGGADWAVKGSPTAFVEQNVNWYNGAAIETVNKQLFSGVVSCVPGDRLEASVYVGVHRCNARVLLQWKDSNGVYFSGVTLGDCVDGEAAGGNWLGGYKRIGGFAVAPAGAVTCNISLVTSAPSAGQSTCYSFWTRPFIGMASASQTTLSPWTPSTNTQLLPDGITTPSISALAGSFGDIEIRPVSGKTGQLRVYDANGVMRVRLGNW